MQDFTNIWDAKVEAWKLMARGVPMSQIASQVPRGERTLRSWKKELLSLSPELVRTLPPEVQRFYEEETGKRVGSFREVPLADQKQLQRHRKDLRKLAQRLRNELHLPSSWYSFIEDFGESGTHCEYSHDKLKIVFLWEVKEDDGVRVRLLCPVEQDSEVRHLFNSLQDHLANSEFCGILQTLDDRRTKGGEYLTLCNKLFLTVTNEIREKTEAEVSLSQDEQDSAIIKPFVLTVCVDALSRARGDNLTSALKYMCESLPDKHVLRYGKNAIATAPSEDELDTYQELHTELRSKYAESTLSKDIAKLSTQIKETEKHMSNELQRFSLTVPLPGYCELCKKALQHEE